MESPDNVTQAGQTESRGFAERIDFLESSGTLDHLDELRRESRELDTLINDAAGLFALGEIDDMLSFVTSRLLDHFIPTHLVFLVELPDGGVESWCFRNMKPDEAAFPVSYYPALREFFVASPYSTPFATLEERFGAERFGKDFRDYEPVWILPMAGIGGLFGVVILGRKMLGGDYSSLERMYADRFIRFLAICIQNRIHRERSITDLKTGLYNHGFFMRRLGEEISHVNRAKGDSALLMIDVDHFKAFNDNWGHLAGDEVLTSLAAVLKRAIRAEDVAARFGGEEFCVLLVDCVESRLLEVAERIRKSVEAMAVTYKDKVLRVTVSIGCCPLDPTWHGEPSSFIDRADRALYRSKTGGRNRSTVYRFGLLGRATAAREP